MPQLIDIILPTMWKDPAIVGNISRYVESPCVNKVIIHDNNPHHRPQDLPKSPKVQILSTGHNIFVNPAWNSAVSSATADIICLLNDDITVNISLFDHISKLDFTEIGVLGTKLASRDYSITQSSIDFSIEPLSIDLTKHIGTQCFGFGVCMFMLRSNYKHIPSLFQVWFGDDYLVRWSESAYTMDTGLITGSISTTVASAYRDPNSDIARRIEQDVKNASRYGFVMRSKLFSMQHDK